VVGRKRKATGEGGSCSCRAVASVREHAGNNDDQDDDGEQREVKRSELRIVFHVSIPLPDCRSRDGLGVVGTRKRRELSGGNATCGLGCVKEW
jgi:hypothetical protein